jgi:predicted RNA binding protein YcfA (HicA-like mRNA interferase family)
VPALQPVPYQTLVRIFEKDGFIFARQSGDHLIYTKPDVKRPRERYFALLAEV